MMELDNPIDLREFLNEKSIFFKIDQEQAISCNDEELLKDDGMTNLEQKPTTTSPWLHKFDELRKTMEPIPNQRDLYKKIIQAGSGDTLAEACMMNCRVHWTYSMFMESEEYAFDSSTAIRKTECDELLPGIWMALRTMRRGEESQFLIGHRLMFGAIGSVCGSYRIKPKADILLVTKLVNFEEIGAEDACDKLNADDLRHYPTVRARVNEMQAKMFDLYDRRAISNAIKIGLEIIERVSYCDILTAADTEDSRELLTSIYVKLIDCFVKVERYKKALDMIESLRKLTNTERFVEVMVNEAIALGKTGDNYKEPIELLRKAQHLYPLNETVHTVLNELQNEQRKYLASTKEFMMKAFQTKPQSTSKATAQATVGNSNENVKTSSSSSTPADDPQLTGIIQSFNEIDIGYGIPLVGYTHGELTKVKEACKQTSNFQLKVTKNHDGETTYTIVKTK